MSEDNLEGSRRVARQVVESVGRFACAPQRGFPECTRRHAFGLPKHTAAQTTQPVYDSDPSRSLVISHARVTTPQFWHCPIKILCSIHTYFIAASSSSEMLERVFPTSSLSLQSVPHPLAPCAKSGVV